MAQKLSFWPKRDELRGFEVFSASCASCAGLREASRALLSLFVNLPLEPSVHTHRACVDVAE